MDKKEVITKVQKIQAESTAMEFTTKLTKTDEHEWSMCVMVRLDIFSEPTTLHVYSDSDEESVMDSFTELYELLEAA